MSKSIAKLPAFFRTYKSPALTRNHYFGNMVTMKSKRIRPSAIATEDTSKEYWDKVLKGEGLGMDAGRDPGHRKLVLVGGSQDIEMVDEIMVKKRAGRVRPKGNGPDDDREADNR